MNKIYDKNKKIFWLMVFKIKKTKYAKIKKNH